tara:strand:+ start:348 stop:1103 length:756 start_codon:yes stop_codon:yes gene_type:complete
MKKFKLFFILAIALTQSCDPSPKAPEKVDLDLYFIPLFNNSEFSFELDSLIQNETKDTLVYSRADFLLSNFQLISDDDSIVNFENTYAFIKFKSTDTVELPLSIPSGNYKELRFNIGLDSSVNHSDPAIWQGGHPLNPSLNNLHWGWTGGYVFAALEGYYQNSGVKTPWIYHVALDENKTSISLQGSLDLTDFKTLEIRWDSEKVFSATHAIRPVLDGNFTHSSNDNGLAEKIAKNLSTSFRYGDLVTRSP